MVTTQEAIPRSDGGHPHNPRTEYLMWRAELRDATSIIFHSGLIRRLADEALQQRIIAPGSCQEMSFVGAKHSIIDGQSISTLQANASPLQIHYREIHSCAAANAQVMEPDRLRPSMGLVELGPPPAMNQLEDKTALPSLEPLTYHHGYPRSVFWFSRCLFSQVLCTPSRPSPQAIEFFEKRIRPVLVEHCQQCHSSRVPKGEGSCRKIAESAEWVSP